MTVLIFSTEEEAAPFLQRYERGRFEGLTEGESLYDDRLLISLTGSGKIKATLRTERLLRQYRQQLPLQRVIHAGGCTALSERHAPGSLIAAAQVFEGDRIEMAAPNYPRMPLETPFNGIPTATLVTQEHVLKDPSDQLYWQRMADAVDMTGYAVAYVTATHGLPCHILKAITGRAGEADTHLRRTLTSAYEALSGALLNTLK